MAFDTIFINKKMARLYENPNEDFEIVVEDSDTVAAEHADWFVDEETENNNLYHLPSGEFGTQTPANSALHEMGRYQIHFKAEGPMQSFSAEHPFVKAQHTVNSTLDVDDFEKTIFQEPVKRTRGTKQSGVQRCTLRLGQMRLPDDVQVKNNEPIHAALIRYHYPMNHFPTKLMEEIREVESFFGKVRRGEGNDLYIGRPVYLISYRLFGRTDEIAIGFTQTIKEIMMRYGVEVIMHESWRVR
jgi:hypothetical protein